jgi:hypothetical protein
MASPAATASQRRATPRTFMVMNLLESMGSIAKRFRCGAATRLQSRRSQRGLPGPHATPHQQWN